MFRALRDTDTVIKLPWLIDGTATTGLTITFAVNDLDGVEIKSGTAAEDGTTGLYEIPLTAADVPDVALLDLVLTKSTESKTRRIEIVGGWLFTEPQAREWDADAGGVGAMASETDYPDDAILEWRDRITDMFETLTGRSWTPRFRRFRFRGSGTRELWLPDAVDEEPASGGSGSKSDIVKVLSADDGAAVSVANIQINKRLGVLYRTDAHWTRPSTAAPYNVTVDLEYGMPEVMEGVDGAALTLLRDRLVRSNIPDRAISWTDEFGNINLDTMPTVARDWLKSNDRRIDIGVG